MAAIKEAGMTPGIWFEPETAGKASEAYRQEEHMLTRNGAVITTAGRRFWDLRDLGKGLPAGKGNRVSEKLRLRICENRL